MPSLQDPSTKLILIVDDDPSTETLLDHVVQLQGFKTALARDGKEALAKAKERRPDLVIMDLMMPEMSGYEAIRALHSVCDGHVPIVINTARRVDPSAVETMRSEANVLELFEKPTDYQRLFELIHKVLKTQPPPHPKHP